MSLLFLLYNVFLKNNFIVLNNIDFNVEINNHLF